ncbi:hypothetical protein OAA27_00040 [bacterium]|nr:hypothetical protein [bacterium]
MPAKWLGFPIDAIQRILQLAVVTMQRLDSIKRVASTLKKSCCLKQVGKVATRASRSNHPPSLVESNPIELQILANRITPA